MIKQIFIAIGLFALPVSAIAEFGIGASFKSSEAGIYIPIAVNERFSIEPYLQYRDRTIEISQDGDGGSSSDSSLTTFSVAWIGRLLPLNVPAA